MFNYLIKVKWKTIDKRWEYNCSNITAVQSILQNFEFNRQVCHGQHVELCDMDDTSESNTMVCEILYALQKADCNEVRVYDGVWRDGLPCELSITKKNITDYTAYSQPNALYRTFQVTPEKVIFNDPATIVFWKDGTKTVVKCMEGDTYNPEVGLAMCVCKKVFDKKYHKFFKYYVPKEPVTKSSEKKEEVSLDEIYDKIAEMAKDAFKTDKSFLEKFASQLFGKEENIK